MSLYARDGSSAKIGASSVDPLQGTKYDFPRDSVGFGRKSHHPQWPNEAKIAVSFVINYEEVKCATIIINLLATNMSRVLNVASRTAMHNQKTDCGSNLTINLH
jgi:hypothetical protein